LIDAVLVLDVSTSCIHANLVNADKKITISLSKSIEYILDGPKGYYSINTTRLWGKITDIIKEVNESAQDKYNILAISVTSQREGSVFLDENNDEIFSFPNIDLRAKRVSYDISSRYGERIYRITGHWPDAYFPAMRLLWIKDFYPEKFKKIRSFLMLNEWIAFKLSSLKIPVSEWTNAAESMLFDVNDLEWSQELRELFGFEELKFSKIVEPGTILNSIDADVSQRTGLSNETKIVLGMADTQSALFGSDAFDEGTVVIVNGSTTPVQIVVNKPIFDKYYRTWTCPYLKNKWVLESNCKKTGVVYKKLKEDLMEFIDMILPKQNNNEIDLVEIIRNMYVRADDLFAYMGPGIFDVSQREISINGLVYDSSKTNIFQSVFTAFIENLAFSIFSNIEQLKEIYNNKILKIVATGGAFKNSLLKKILYILIKPVEFLLTDELESTSIGAAKLAFREINKKDFPATDNFSKIDVDFSGEEENYYKNKYLKWKEFYKSLKNLGGNINE